MTMDFTELRRRMAASQLKARGIRNSAVLEAMGRVPRHAFVPANYQDQAYVDGPIPIGGGQTISQPYMAALMTEALEPSAQKSVLEIGTGSGYQTAVLAELCAAVYSVERIESLAIRAREKLAALGYKNIHIAAGDGTLGWTLDIRQFDAIMVTAGSPTRLEHLWGQLREDGRMVVPIGDRLSQRLTLFVKDGPRMDEKKEIFGRPIMGSILSKRIAPGIRELSLCSCTFVPLIGEKGWQGGP